MAEAEQEELPTVLFVRSSPSPYVSSTRYNLLKSWESPLPTGLFIASAAAAARIRAIVVSPASSFAADANSLAALPDLQFIMTTSAGTDHIDLAYCTRRGIQVASAGPVFSVDTAEYAVGLLIDVMRRVSAADRYVRKGLWPLQGDYPLGNKLTGKRVGMVGLGNIGSEIVKRLKAFGCTISYNSRQPKPWLAYTFFSCVRDLASASDILVVCCALNSETHHIINRDVMLALGKEGFVINVGRGALIDEKALVECLMRGEIAGAGLDVFENEPDVPQELLDADNVVLSGHRAVFTEDAVENMAKLVADNLDAFFSNRPLLTPVSLQ